MTDDEGRVIRRPPYPIAFGVGLFAVSAVVVGIAVFAGCIIEFSRGWN
jgi:hypothetical protein